MKSVRQAMHLLGHESRGRWVLLIVLALGSSGVEVVGAALVLLLLGLIAGPEGSVGLPFIGQIGDVFDLSSDSLMIVLATSMAAFFVFRAVVHVGVLYAQNRVAHNAGARLARRMVHGYLSMPYAFHLTRTSSDLIRNSHQAVQQLVTGMFLPLIRISAESIIVLGMFGFLLVVAPLATVLAVALIGGTAALLLLTIQPRLKKIGRVAHQMNRETLNVLQQSLHGIRDVKVLHRETAFAERYGRARSKLARASYLRATASDLPKTIMELVLLGFILLVFVISVVAAQPQEGTLSLLGVFAYAGLRIQPSIQKIIAGLNSIRYSSAPIDDVSKDLREIEQQERGPEASNALGFEQELRVDRVSFCYETAASRALEEMSFVIKPGQVIGICGATGAGKTTLVDIIAGLLQPTSGRISVDGHDLACHAREWQRNLGVVSQMVFLTDETLAENIALGVRRVDIDPDAVWEALRLAQLENFVTSLPDGIDTRVGERGVRVSGGQRQRIAIARALYHRPAVLIFDEGTSALDNVTERELMDALSRLRGDHTILLVAHRLSTVKLADSIVFLKDGRLAGLGSYPGLLRENPAFCELARGSD